MKIITRHSQENELTKLKVIWHTVFGEAGAASFFNTVQTHEHTIVAEYNGKPAAMGFIIDAGEMICEDMSLRCAMLYGIATHPEQRGIGLGKAVVNSLIETAYSRGFKAAVLCPSEDSLFEYYSKNTKMRDWFYSPEYTFTQFTTASIIANKKYPEPATPAEYISLREKLLINIPHIKSNVSVMEYQKQLCDELGGGLYKIGDSCAIVEVQLDKTVYIKELLTPDENANDMITLLTSQYKTDNITVRLPAKKEESIINTAGINTARRFGMLALKDDSLLNFNDSAFLPWYGPAFD